MKGLIQDDRIAQLAADDETFPVASPLMWVDVPDGTTTDHRWDGSKPVPPPAATAPVDEAAEAKARAREAVIDALIDDPAYAALPEIVDYKTKRK